MGHPTFYSLFFLRGGETLQHPSTITIHGDPLVRSRCSPVMLGLEPNASFAAKYALSRVVAFLFLFLFFLFLRIWKTS